MKKFERPSAKDALSQVWLIGPVVLEKKIFKILSIYFHYFVIISPLKRTRPFIWKKLEFPSPKDALIVLSLVEIGPGVLEKKIFKFH